MTEGPVPDGQRRTVPVDPPVHVETFATHCTLTWKANGLPPFVDTVRALDAVPAAASVVVDDKNTAGRTEQQLAALDELRDTIRYLRVAPPTGWTLSWERRTWPVVSLSGTPSPELCRRVHRGTTDCSQWTDEALATLENVTAAVR